MSAIDQAIAKNVLHENTANRYKSRLTLAYNGVKAKREVVRVLPLFDLIGSVGAGFGPPFFLSLRGLMSTRSPSPAFHTPVSRKRCAKIPNSALPSATTCLVADWEAGSWKQPQIVPFGPISFSPALTPFHYGQAIFEGFKAHRTASSGLALFRPRDNFARLNRSAARLAMPEIPESLSLGASQNWFGSIANGSPIARVALSTFAQHTSASTTLFSFARQPSPPHRHDLFPLVPISRNRFVFSPKSASSAPSLGAPVTAKPPATTPVASSPRESPGKRFHNVLCWTGSSAVTSKNPRYERLLRSGRQSHYSALSGTILPGVTRDSALTLLREMGTAAEERQISIDEVLSRTPPENSPKPLAPEPPPSSRPSHASNTATASCNFSPSTASSVAANSVSASSPSRPAANGHTQLAAVRLTSL